MIRTRWWGRFPGFAALMAMLSLCAVSQAAAPIPSLFHTGVDGFGVDLPGLADDPHYAIILDPGGGAAPDMVVPNDGFPIGAWYGNSVGSQWIGPLDLNPGNDANGPAGDFFYETTLDLTGYDPTNWFASGAWATDDGGPAILVNGANVVGGFANVTNAASAGFGGPTSFAISPSVVANAGGGVGAGPNSLILHVNNGGGPTGLRVDGLYSRAAPAGSVKIPGLHNTGVDAADLPLPTGVDDPHYQLVAPGVVLPDQTAVTNGVFPIPPWIPNSATSRWITPPDPNGNGPPVSYYYETEFDLTGLDPASAVITGLWSSDNFGVEILLNGVPTGNPQIGSFVALSYFEISSALGDAFLPGINKLTFVVDNAPPGDNPVGLRVEGLVAHANPIPEPSAIVLVGVGLAVLAARRRIK